MSVGGKPRTDAAGHVPKGWDHDPPAPPALFDIVRGGTTIPALAITTKSGYMYILNRETGQPVPKTPGELVRSAYESLALKYRQVLGWLEELTGNRIEVIHIVGGGSQSGILNQFTADACRRPVVTGPVEATAMGNLLVQVRSSGEISSLAEMRSVIRKSARVKRYEPGKAEPWEAAAARFANLQATTW